MDPETDTATVTTTDPDPINPLAAAFAEAGIEGSPDNDGGTPDFIGSLLQEVESAAADDEPDPTAAEPETTPVADTGVADKPEGATSENAIRTWGEMKKELKELRQQKADLEARVKETPAPTKANEDELRQLRDQIRELEAKAQFAEEAERELSISRVEATREYKRVVDEPLQAIGNAAAEIADRAGVDKEKLFTALSTRDNAARNKMLSDLVDGMDDVDRLDIVSMARDTQAILRKRDEFHERAVKAKEELDIRAKEEETRAAAQAKQTFLKTLDRVAADLKDRLPLSPIEDGEDVNEVYESAVAKARSADFSISDPQVQAFSALAAVVLPRLIKQVRAESRARKAAEERIAELHGASPTSPTTPTQASAPSSEQDFLASVLTAVGSGLQ